VLQC